MKKTLLLSPLLVLTLLLTACAPKEDSNQISAEPANPPVADSTLPEDEVTTPEEGVTPPKDEDYTGKPIIDIELQPIEVKPIENGMYNLNIIEEEEEDDNIVIDVIKPPVYKIEPKLPNPIPEL